jgi:hypothetical protein
VSFTNQRPLSVDGTRLDTLAYNIETIDGRRQLPGVRANDVVVPGRHGEVPSIYDDFEPGRIVLRMWIRSTDVDGNNVPGANPKDTLQRNLDRLFALFRPRNRLLTVTQQVGASTEKRSSYLLNPRLDKSGATTNVRTNYLLNPSMDRSTSTTVYRSNLVPNPSFEVATSGWSTSNANIARIAGAASGLQGAWHGEFTATAVDPLASSGVVSPLTVGKVYTASAYIAGLTVSGVDGGDPRMRIGIRWINGASAIISEDWADPVEVTANFRNGAPSPAWRRVFVDGQAPTGAVTARVVVQGVASANGTPVAVGNVFCVDGVLMEDPVDDDTYFDGSVTNYGTVQWTGVAHASTSQALRAVVDNYGTTPGAGQNLMSGASTDPAFGTRCMVWRAIQTFTEGTRFLWNQNSLPADNLGARWSASIYCRTDMDDPPRLGLRVAGCDVSGNFVAYTTGTASSTLPAQATFTPDSVWRRYKLEGSYTSNFPASVTQVRLELVAVDQIEDGSFFLFDAATLEPLPTTPHYFDGDSGDTTELKYVWDGTADASYSRMQGGTVASWTATRGTLIHTAEPDSFATTESRACGKYTVTSTSGGISFSNFLFSSTQLADPGSTWNAGCFVNGGAGIEMAQVSIESFNGGTSVQVSRGIPVNTATSNDWTWVPGPASGSIVPGSCDRIRMNIHLWREGDIVPTVGAVAYINGATLATGLSPVDYFDEYSGGSGLKPGRIEKLPDIRQAICKTDAAIEAGDAQLTVGGDYTQRFSVSLKIPDVFWRDTDYVYWQSTNQPTNKLRLYEVGPLRGSTAPLEDLVVVVHGPAQNPYVQDPETGWFVKYRGLLPAGQSWKVDAGRWLSGVAKTGTAWNAGTWRNVIGQTDYESGRATMFTLHPFWNEARQDHICRIKMYGGVRFYVLARRKYL